MKLLSILKTIIKEEILKFNDRVIHKNPEHLNDSPQYIRGIIDSEGNLFVKYHTFSHNQLVLILKAYNLIPFDMLTNHTMKYIIPVERDIEKGKDNFYLSYSFSKDYIDKNKNHIIRILKKCKEKNPQFNFYPKRDID